MVPMKRYLMIILLLAFSVIVSGCRKDEFVEVSPEDSLSETEASTEPETETSEIEISETKNSETETTETDALCGLPKEYVSRLMTADLSTAEEAEGVDDWNTVVRLAELPEYDITMYGYNDEEYHGNGVAIQMGEDVNYFDWSYITPSRILPELYWDDEKKQLQVALNIYHGTGVAAQQFHILQQYQTGTLSDITFDHLDYSS